MTTHRHFRCTIIPCDRCTKRKPTPTIKPTVIFKGYGNRYSDKKDGRAEMCVLQSSMNVGAKPPTWRPSISSVTICGHGRFVKVCQVVVRVMLVAAQPLPTPRCPKKGSYQRAGAPLLVLDLLDILSLVFEVYFATRCFFCLQYVDRHLLVGAG
jgi:hypothetical protein